MKAIKFAEWLAENHYRLYNVDISGIRFWKDETNKQKTTEQLYKKFEKSTNT